MAYYLGYAAAALIAAGVVVPLGLDIARLANFAGYVSWCAWLVAMAIVLWRATIRYRCMMWCMKRTNIYLAEGQADALDRVAQAAGVSRAELIRELIDRAIGGHPGTDLVADLAAIDGSFGILAGQDAFAREPDERMSYLDRLADA